MKHPILAAVILLGLGACSSGSSGSPAAELIQADLAVTPCGPGSLRITWRDALSDETGYFVERTVDPELGPLPAQVRAVSPAQVDVVGTVSANATVFVDTGLLPDRDYSYRIRARRDGDTRLQLSGTVTARTSADGFFVFRRRNELGGEDFYYASTDGTVAPVAISGNGGSVPSSVIDHAIGDGRWLAYSIGNRALLAPLFCDPALPEAKVVGAALDPGGSTVVGTMGTLDDRVLLSSLNRGGDAPTVVATDLQTLSERVVASNISGTVVWDESFLGDTNHLFVEMRQIEGVPWGEQFRSTVWRSGALTEEATEQQSVTAGVSGRETLLRGDDGKPIVQGGVAIAVETIAPGSPPAPGAAPPTSVRWVAGPTGGAGVTLGVFDTSAGPTWSSVIEDEGRVLYLRDQVSVDPRFEYVATSLSEGTTTSLSGPLNGTVFYERVRTDTHVLLSQTIGASVHLLGIPLAGGSPIPITGNSTASPIQGEFQLGVFHHGHLLVYPRRSDPGALFFAFLGQAMSEQPLSLPGTARVVAPVRGKPTAEGQGAIERWILTATSTIGGENYSDFWSIRESGPGQSEILRLSNQIQSTQVSDGPPPGPGFWSTVPVGGRLVFQRGVDLFSVDPAVADSEVRLTSLDLLVDSVLVDPDGESEVVFFVAQGQVWSVDVKGATPPVQLTEFSGGSAVLTLHQIDGSGRVVFSVDATTTRWIYSAQAGVRGSAMSLSGTGQTSDTFEFGF